MDTRADFQRLLEDMDKVIQSKRQELTELDERLEIARVQLSEKEASELRRVAIEMDLDSPANSMRQKQQQQLASSSGSQISFDEQRRLYEQQLEQFGEELSELESINQALAKENESLRSELQTSRTSSEKFSAQARVLAENLEEVQSANLELNLRLARAESESQMQQKLLKKSHDEDEVLMDAFNDKLESLKRAIEWRDEEIRRLQSDGQFALESFGTLMDSTNKQSVIEIASAFREKDSQIELLKSQLLQATKDLEQNASLLEILKQDNQSQQQASIYGTSNLQSQEQQHQLQLQLERVEEFSNRNKMLEDELEAKDRQLNLNDLRIHHYENILPNMISDLIEKLLASLGDKWRRRPQQQQASAEERSSLELIEILGANLSKLLAELNQSQKLLDQIEHLNGVTQNKEAQIERLVSELNELDAKFSLVQQQCDLLQSKWAGDEESTSDGLRDSLALVSAIGEEGQSSGDGDKGEEEEKRQQKQKAVAVVERPKIRTRHRKFEELSSAAATTGGAITAPVSNAAPASPATLSARDSEPVGGTAQVATATTFTSTSAVAAAKSSDFDRTLVKLQSRLRQLENENELLELAMKEILLSIKWSDAQCSTVLIDCPSLERLCQLIEARFLARSAAEQQEQQQSQLAGTSGERRRRLPIGIGTTSSESQLFQLVVLKSELDLLRGQNEQLRADIKLQRREYQEDLVETTIKQQDSKRAQLLVSSTEQLATAEDDAIDEHWQQRQQVSSGGDIPAYSMGQQQQRELQEEPLSTARGSPDGDSSGESANVETGGRCKNCTRLTNLTNRLLQCIVRIEARVNASDETYLNRLVSLHKLNQMLERDLIARESLLSESRRQCHLLIHQKFKAELRLQLWEEQATLMGRQQQHHHHQQQQRVLTTASVADSRDAGRQQPTGSNLRMYMSAENGEGDSISQRVTISSGGGGSIVQHSRQQQASGARSSRASPQMTITLLKSIINCLQARLDYKDDRLRQLESLLSSSSGRFANNLTPNGSSSPAEAEALAVTPTPTPTPRTTPTLRQPSASESASLSQPAAQQEIIQVS